MFYECEGRDRDVDLRCVAGTRAVVTAKADTDTPKAAQLPRSTKLDLKPDTLNLACLESYDV